MTKMTIFAAAVLFATGCRGSRFANCTADSNCGRDQARCVDSICAQCRGEDDCKAPLICGRDHTCKSLVSASGGSAMNE